MLNYAQVLERIDPRHSALLLGNGFSRAWDDRIFAYDSLLKAANFGEQEERIRQLFTQLETSDFERVTNRLRAAHDLLTVYGNVGNCPLC